MTTAVAAAPMTAAPVVMGTYQDWLVAWKEWARTRKRGKMAQFIVDKLEDSKQARWLSISEGKFELTNWHDIAKEWFKEKPRNSDQVDAPCMLRKGLPRAFPGLEEVKGESVKEGTQYRSRVFMAPRELVTEVMMYIQNGRGGPHMMAPPPPVSVPYHVQYGVSSAQMTPYNSTMGQVQSPPQVMSNGISTSPHMYGGHPIKIDPDYVDSPSASETQSPYYVVHQQQPGAPYISSSQASADVGLADMNHHSPSSTIYSDPPDSASPYQQQQPTLDNVLQLPPGMGGGMGVVSEGGWISPSSHSQANSPRYSPDPGDMTTGGAGGGGVGGVVTGAGGGGGVSYPVDTMGMAMNPGPHPSGGGGGGAPLQQQQALVSPPLQPHSLIGEL